MLASKIRNSYYNFVKIGDKNENFCCKMGGLSAGGEDLGVGRRGHMALNVAKYSDITLEIFEYYHRNSYLQNNSRSLPPIFFMIFAPDPQALLRLSTPPVVNCLSESAVRIMLITLPIFRHKLNAISISLP